MLWLNCDSTDEVPTPSSWGKVKHVFIQTSGGGAGKEKGQGEAAIAIAFAIVCLISPSDRQSRRNKCATGQLAPNYNTFLGGVDE